VILLAEIRPRDRNGALWPKHNSASRASERATREIEREKEKEERVHRAVVNKAANNASRRVALWAHC